MKIICTEEEKKGLMRILDSSWDCPFNPEACGNDKCEECLNGKRILWEIIERGE